MIYYVTQKIDKPRGYFKKEKLANHNSYGIKTLEKENSALTNKELRGQFIHTPSSHPSGGLRKYYRYYLSRFKVSNEEGPVGDLPRARKTCSVLMKEENIEHLQQNLREEEEAETSIQSHSPSEPCCRTCKYIYTRYPQKVRVMHKAFGPPITSKI
ncbi:hypothetical protein Anas_13148 [Armadillidium nasatum]|uniref:Uncharacterized protein n=1 Tax=Armadillidium nasatum TaxID=96803 RepID=A0A5N5T9Q3_9CRUS|nr:hypothetical protein Anas_13148 [Armadillidium nasatum]